MRRRQHPALDVLLQALGVEVAALHVASPQLADPQLLRDARLIEGGEPAELVALYLQFRAPRRHT